MLIASVLCSATCIALHHWLTHSSAWWFDSTEGPSPAANTRKRQLAEGTSAQPSNRQLQQRPAAPQQAQSPPALPPHVQAAQDAAAEAVEAALCQQPRKQRTPLQQQQEQQPVQARQPRPAASSSDDPPSKKARSIGPSAALQPPAPAAAAAIRPGLHPPRTGVVRIPSSRPLKDSKRADADSPWNHDHGGLIEQPAPPPAAAGRRNTTVAAAAPVGGPGAPLHSCVVPCWLRLGTWPALKRWLLWRAHLPCDVSMRSCCYAIIK